MSELITFYQKQATSPPTNLPWLDALKHQALDDFVKKGFPARSQEEWRHTSADSFLKHRFSPVTSMDVSLEASPNVTNELPEKHHLHLTNGTVVGLDTLTSSLPEGMVVLPMLEALQRYPDKIKPYLGRILPHEHGFQALNTAMLRCGLWIYLPEGVHLEHPLVLTHWQDQADQAVYWRHLIVAEAGSHISLIEDFQGESGCCYFTNTATEIHAAERAIVHHYKIQQESKHAYHIGHVAAIQKAESEVYSHSLSLGGKFVRSDTDILPSQPHARCLLNGVYLPGGGQLMDHHTSVIHDVPDCESAQDYKGILFADAKAVFNSKVLVAKGAKQSKANQQNKNVLLSEKAEVNTKPQMEIFADDVICTHGATVGQLDEDALFYLAARGIDRLQASRYLMEAFVSDNLKKVTNPTLARWLQTLLLDACNAIK